VDIFSWIAEEFMPEIRPTTALIYDAMASQSGEALPIIYRPFDAGHPGHWQDRGSALDFALSTRCEGQRVLDFGPGDGWPSLIIAPYAGEVVGVDGSARRVSVCAANAARLGITNATFHHVAPGSRLPFDDNSFGAVVAASSVEQTPDPRATLTELCRVLRPGGKLRLSYESLKRYSGGEEREAWLWALDDGSTRLMLYDRATEEEIALQVALTFGLPRDEVGRVLGASGDAVAFSDVTQEALSRLLPAVVDAGACTTRHPSCGTWMRWLSEVGFGLVVPTHSGAEIAGRVFGTLSEDERPDTLERIDAYLRPIVAIAIELPAPVELDPMITAVK
jgi:SAM-dependent methyltransferase